MRLLLLASLRAQTGNGTTAQRIQGHLEAAGHVCTLKDTFSCESPLAVSKLISENFDAALGIHLYKAGRLLQGSGIPFGIVFGGTDINEDARCEKKAQVMGTVLDEARFAVSFTEAMRERAISYWPLARNKIYVQAQGIVTAPNISFNWKKYLQSAGITQDHNRLRFFFLICGLRRVKDPLYLVDAFVEWHREDPSIHLIIIGPAAMDLNVPVLARNIPGNAAIITDKATGLLYSNPEEFVQLSKSLIEDPSLQREIVTRAKAYVTKHHLWEDERNAYQNFVLRLH
ncbi:glycosyltransferase 1 domain-containing protein 1 [Sceloporus undulatus]|uniref:glycosyltransferase 1 domain-containing protein 1 n=1 Tax=Sceloporus undulatus TaxID=8520 RepID=UPI001C4B5625|nr:glycosyltransferase 1 domain-containing protein 1 [Sceloporus undulatus]